MHLQKHKFRARSVNGGIFYGDLLHENGKVYIRSGYDKPLEEVEENSIAQLVGYVFDPDFTSAFTEVYEGDELITPDGTHIYAAICYHAKTEKIGDLDFTELAKENGWSLVGR